MRGQLDINGDVMKAAGYEPLFIGEVRDEDRYSKVIRRLMVFKAMGQMRSPRKSVQKSKVLGTEVPSHVHIYTSRNYGIRQRRVKKREVRRKWYGS